MNLIINSCLFLKKKLLHGDKIRYLSLLILFPVLMGSFTELARAGDSFSVPIHYAIAAFALIVIYVSLELSLTVSISLMFIYLIFLGWIRRTLIPTTGFLSNDPVTLVSTLASGLFFIKLLIKNKVPKFTEISKNINLLVLIMFFEIFNPFQGGFAVGLGGIIFRMTPMFWYYIGVSRGNRSILSYSFVLIIICAVIQSITGIYQTVFGFSEVEKFWITFGGGTQSLGGTLYRSVGTLLSFSEYTVVLIIGCSISWAMVLSKKYIAIFPFLLLFAATILSSSRGAVVTLSVVIISTIAIQGKQYREWIPRLLLSIILAIWGLTFSLERVKNIETNVNVETIINHQVKGLSDPLGKQSTGGTHLWEIGNGILDGFRFPIGRGLGAGTLAGKLGEGTIATEFDVSDMFLSLGFPGGILYIVICIRIGVSFFRYWHDTREKYALYAIALLISSQGQWISGAHYSNSMMFWFIIGTMDKIIWNYREDVKNLHIGDVVNRE